MSTPVVASIIVAVLGSTLTFVVTFIWNGRRNRRLAAKQAARQEIHDQLITQLLKTSLNDRMAVALTAFGMINAGPYKLLTPAIADKLPWHWKFVQELCAVAYRNGLGTFNALRSMEHDTYDEALHTLACSPAFMLFAVQNSRLINGYLDVYYSSTNDIPREVRGEVYGQIVTQKYLDELTAIITAEHTRVQPTIA